MTRSRITGKVRSGVTVIVSSSAKVDIRVMHMQPRPTVDLGAARAALAGLAVPPHREVAGLGGLQPVDDVEHHLALVHLDGVVHELAALGVAAPDPELRLMYAHRHVTSGPRPARGLTRRPPACRGLRELFLGEVLRQLVAVEQREQVGPHRRHRLLDDLDVARRTSEQTRLTLRHSAYIVGKSSRVCPPRTPGASVPPGRRTRLTESMLRRSSARCQPGLNCRPTVDRDVLARAP